MASAPPPFLLRRDITSEETPGQQRALSGGRTAGASTVAAAASFPTAAAVALPAYTPALHRRPTPAGAFDPPMHTVRGESGWRTAPAGSRIGVAGTTPNTRPSSQTVEGQAHPFPPVSQGTFSGGGDAEADGMAGTMVRGFSAVARLAGLTSVGTGGSGGGGLGGSSWALDEELQADLAAAVGTIGDEEEGEGRTQRWEDVDYASQLPGQPPVWDGGGKGKEDPPRRKDGSSHSSSTGDGAPAKASTAKAVEDSEGELVTAPPRLIDPSFEESLFPNWGHGRIGTAAILAAHAFYQQLYLWMLAANAVVLALALRDIVHLSPDDLPLVALINLAVSVAARNEVALRVFYYLLTRAPHGLPRGLRVALCRFAFHVGGIHSGTATAAAGWLLYFAIQVVRGRAAVDGGPAAAVTAVRVLAWVLVAAVGTLCATSVPFFRAAHHDVWELTHRYLGWSTLGVLWAFLATDAVRRAGVGRGSSGGGGGATVAWVLAAAITASVAMPWAFVRRVPVKSLVPHHNTVVLQFPGGSPAAGTFGRVSHHPLGCWHSFATVSAARHGRTHAMVVSAVGDWTRALVATPPSSLWVRRLHAPGFMYNVRLFRRVVVLATGAGIAPVLPHLLQTPAAVRVVWVCRNPEDAFGPEIPAIVASGAGSVVHDTATGGRVDMTELVLRVAHDAGAEAVFVVSGEGVTRAVVGGCLVQGVPAFGAIWDS